MNKITMTLRYSLLQFLIWGIYGIVIGFSASYFLDCGLSDAGYGLALGIASALAFLAQLAMGELISRLPKLTIHIAVRILTCAMALCGGALLMIKLSAVRILLFALILVLMQVIPGLLNALGMAAARQALKVNFGIARGVGSMSYALFSFLTGQAIVLVGQGAVPGLTAALSVLLFCGLWLFPNVGCGSKDTVEKDRMGRPLCRDLLFLALLICTTLLFVSNNLMVNFLLQLVRSRGGNEAGVGIAAAISAMAELPTMFLFGWMLRKLRCDSWLKISAICMTVKSVICLLATHLGVLYPVQGTLCGRGGQQGKPGPRPGYAGRYADPGNASVLLLRRTDSGGLRHPGRPGRLCRLCGGCRRDFPAYAEKGRSRNDWADCGTT